MRETAETDSGARGSVLCFVTDRLKARLRKLLTRSGYQPVFVVEDLQDSGQVKVLIVEHALASQSDAQQLQPATASCPIVYLLPGELVATAVVPALWSAGVDLILPTPCADTELVCAVESVTGRIRLSRPLPELL